MSENYTLVEPKEKRKSNHKSIETKPIKIYNTTNTKTEIKRTKINDWSKVAEKCELYKIFTTGQRRLHHDELFGLSLSLMYLEGGKKRILETIAKYPDLYNKEKDKNWGNIIESNKKYSYSPKKCDNFCPFKDSCKHYHNMRNTVVPRNAIYMLSDNIKYIDIDEAFKMLFEELKRRIW